MQGGNGGSSALNFDSEFWSKKEGREAAARGRKEGQKGPVVKKGPFLNGPKNSPFGENTVRVDSLPHRKWI